MKVTTGDFDWSRLRSARDKKCHSFYQDLKKYLFVIANSDEKIYTTSTFLATTSKAATSKPTTSKAATSKASTSKASKAQPEDDNTLPGPQTRSKATTDNITPEPTFSKEVIRDKTRAKDRKTLARNCAKKGTHSPSAASVRQRAIEQNEDEAIEQDEDEAIEQDEDGDDKIVLSLPVTKRLGRKRKAHTSNKPLEYYNNIIRNLFNDHSKKLKLDNF